jgi:dTMP kinase
LAGSDSLFIVVEGLDGAGKSEMSRRLAEALAEQLGAGQVLLTAEPQPDYCAGDFLRAALQRRVEPVNDWTLALAFAANRADHTARLIDPFLAGAGRRAVVCDRYYLSSLVYQSNERTPPAVAMELNRAARRPELILFLNASNEVCYARMGRRDKDPEMFEDQLEQLREKYVAGINFLRSRGEAVEVVDADQEIPAVLAEMLRLVEQYGKVAPA